MKILNFGILYFSLPDDFDGGFSDALRLLADYHDSVAGTSKQKIGEPQDTPSGISAQEYEKEIWEKFWDVVQTSDKRVIGSAGLTVYNEESGKLDDLQLNTGELKS